MSAAIPIPINNPDHLQLYYSFPCTYSPLLSIPAGQWRAQFKRHRSLEKEDYTKAYDYLTAAVKDHPGGPEAHYFLGYAIDRIHANDGAGMICRPVYSGLRYSAYC